MGLSGFPGCEVRQRAARMVLPRRFVVLCVSLGVSQRRSLRGHDTRWVMHETARRGLSKTGALRSITGAATGTTCKSGTVRCDVAGVGLAEDGRVCGWSLGQRPRTFWVIWDAGAGEHSTQSIFSAQSLA
jgi:hypothetical protein